MFVIICAKCWCLLFPCLLLGFTVTVTVAVAVDVGVGVAVVDFMFFPCLSYAHQHGQQHQEQEQQQWRQDLYLIPVAQSCVTRRKCWHGRKMPKNYCFISYFYQSVSVGVSVCVGELLCCPAILLSSLITLVY